MSTWVYNFDKKIKGAQFPLKNLLGGKGANLSEMIRIGLPVPPGFTITTEACNEFYKSKQKYPKSSCPGSLLKMRQHSKFVN